MQQIRLKLWVKILIVVAIGILAYFVVRLTLFGSDNSIKTVARINSVEMESSAPKFLNEFVGITNLTDSGFNVVWVTKEKNVGVANVKDISSNISTTIKDERISLENRNDMYKIHSTKASFLKPEMTYDLFIDGLEDGRYSVLTPKILSSPPAYLPISGTFVTDLDISEALFIFTIVDNNSNPISTSISTTLLEDNTWLTSIGDMRDLESWSYMDFANKDNKLQIEIFTVQGTYKINLPFDDVLETELELIIK